MNHSRCPELLFLLLLASALGCKTPEIKEKQPEPQARQAEAGIKEVDTPKPAQLPAPALAEVRAALARIYHGSLILPQPTSYVVGDFNGDGSQDLVVVAQPRAAAIVQLNDELANWIVQQPRGNPSPGVRPQVKEGDRLLAIVHGQGGTGWRNSGARQSYLLREAAGLQLRVAPFSPSKSSADMPAMFAGRDVIHEKLRGETGYIYWDGAHYRWHPDL
jgi:hypothetical protein